MDLMNPYEDEIKLTPEQLDIRLESRLERSRKTRLLKQQKQDDALLPHVTKPVNTIIQIGIGHWYEGNSLKRRFQSAQLIGVEPVKRYARSAITAGFRGRMHVGFAWHKSGIERKFSDQRHQTSVFNILSRRNKKIVGCNRPMIRSTSITIDDLTKGFKLGTVFIWMDCEGSELNALKGGTRTLANTAYILSELSCGKDAVCQFVAQRGFKKIASYGNNILFEKA